MNGAIWVVSRKGKAATLRDVDVIEAAKDARLVDNKVVLVLGDAHRAPAGDPGRAPPALTAAGRTIRACRPTCCSS